MSNSIPLGGHPNKMRKHVGALVEQLQPGRGGIRSSYDIAQAIGVNQRAVGYIVREARLQGHLVGSDHGRGYYLIETHEELRETREHLLARTAGIQRTVDALDAAWGAA